MALAELIPCSLVDVTIHIASSKQAGDGVDQSQTGPDFDTIGYGEDQNFFHSLNHEVPFWRRFDSWVRTGSPSKTMHNTACVRVVHTGVLGIEPGVWYQPVVASQSWIQVASWQSGEIAVTLRFTTERDSAGRGVLRVFCDGVMIEDYRTETTVDYSRLVSELYVRCPYPHWKSSRTTLRVGPITVASTWRVDPGQSIDGFYYLNKRVVVGEDGLPLAGASDLSRDWDHWFANVSWSDLGSYRRARDIYVSFGGWMRKDWFTLADSHIYLNQVGRQGSALFALMMSCQFYPRICRAGVAATTDRTCRTKIAYPDSAGTSLNYVLAERADDKATWSSPIIVAIGENLHYPALAAYDDGTVTCWYMAGGVQHAALSTDDGRTWQELTVMMGSTLRNVAVTQHHGITLGVGVSGGNLYFVRSNDQGRTQDGIPGGSAMQLVGACAADCRPAITWYPDGEVAVWAEDADGTEVCYVNSTSGYGSWSQVS